MPEIEIRPAISTDINRLVSMDHSVSTDHILQMDRQKDDNQVNISFRKTHLPRAIRISYPRKIDSLKDDWQKRSIIMVALIGEEIVGYISVVSQPQLQSVWITDIVVDSPFRRKGIGYALMMTIRDWAHERNAQKVIIETPIKNYPAISLFQKAGFEFCGYNERYYANQDIALFYGYIFRR